MASGLKIIDTENLNREKTLLIRYYLNSTGEWVYAIDNCGYKPVCDEYWTIMYPNFQHPQHTDASPDRPLVILTGSLYGTFAWNYGGIPGIEPSDFDSDHSYLVQVTMVNQGCLFTGNQSGQTGQTGTTGSSGISGIAAPPESGYLPPKGPIRIPPGYGAPPYPKIPGIITPVTGTLIRVTTPDPNGYHEIVDPENGYYSKPIEFAENSLNYSNLPIRDLSFGFDPLKPSLFYNRDLNEISENPMFNQREKDRNKLPQRFDNTLNSDPAGWQSLNPDDSFTNKNLTPSFVFGDKNAKDMNKVGKLNKSFNNPAIDLLVEGSKADDVISIPRTIDVAGGASLDASSRIPSLDFIPGIGPSNNDVNTKIAINELPAGLEAGSYNTKNYSALDTTLDSATKPYTASSVVYNSDIVISSASVRRGEQITIAASCHPNTDVSIYGKIIIVDTEGKQIEAAVSSASVCNINESAKIAMTIRTDVYALGKIFINALFFDSSNNIVAQASRTAEIIDQVTENASAIPNNIRTYRQPLNDTISDSLARYTQVDINNYIDFYIDDSPRVFILKILGDSVSFVLKSLNPTTLDTNLIARIFNPESIASMAGSSTRRVDIIQQSAPALESRSKIMINDVSVFDKDHIIGMAPVGLPFDTLNNPVLVISKYGSNTHERCKIRMYLHKDVRLLTTTRTNYTNDGINDIITYDTSYGAEEIKMLIGGKDQYDIPDNVVMYSSTGSLVGSLTYTIPTSTVANETWIHLLRYPYNLGRDIIYSERYY